MLKRIKSLVFLSMMFLTTLSTVNATDKMYIDCEEFNPKDETFRIHIGNNVWIETNTVHRDNTGLYTYENNIIRSVNGTKTEHQRKWKCPYCYKYWPLGQKCGNPDCPSKYKNQ